MAAPLELPNDIPELPDPPGSAAALREAAEIEQVRGIVEGGDTRGAVALLEAPSYSVFITRAFSLLGATDHLLAPAVRFLEDLIDQTSLATLTRVASTSIPQGRDRDYAAFLLNHHEKQVARWKRVSDEGFQRRWFPIVEYAAVLGRELIISGARTSRIDVALQQVVNLAVRHGIAARDVGVASVVATHAVCLHRLDGLPALRTADALAILATIGPPDAFRDTCLALKNSAHADLHVDSDFADQLVTSMRSVAERCAEYGLATQARCALGAAIEVEAALIAEHRGWDRSRFNTLKALQAQLDPPTTGLEMHR